MLEKFLDYITTLWNVWAQPRGCPAVKMLNSRRAVAARRLTRNLMDFGFQDPTSAFNAYLAKCDESFFVKGSPRKPLDFDQLLGDAFMTRMMEGSYTYRPQKKEVRAWAN